MKKTTLTKSFIAILSAATMTALSASAVFAADGSSTFSNIGDDTTFNTTSGATQNIDVWINVPTDTDGDGYLDDGDPTNPTPIYDDGNKIPDPVPTNNTQGTYKVDIEWEDMTFNYIGGQWNTDNFKYDGGSWDKASAKVTVTNYSNWSVDYTAKFDNDDTTKTENGVTAKLGGTTAATLAAVEIGAEAANANDFVLEIAGVPTANGKFPLGTINIALTPGEIGQQN